MQDENLMDQWEQAEQETASPSTLEQMDNLIQELARARATYEEKKRASTEAHDALEEVEKKVIGALKANGRSKFEAEGVGLAYISEREVYTVPKDTGNKTKLFNYIKEKYGPDALMSMVGINYQTLNSWANKEIEAGVMQIPGLEAPTMQETLNFRRKS